MMEVIHHFIVQADEEMPGELDLKKVLKRALPLFDGGFTVGGLVGNGDGFVFRGCARYPPGLLFC